MTEKLKEQREKILSKLGEIVESATVINEEMKDVPHKGRGAYMEFKDDSWINHRNKGLIAQYKHTNGKFYQINIQELF